MADADDNRSQDTPLFQTNPTEIMFRSSALERLAMREDLDELFLAGHRRIWVLLPATILLMAALATWLMDW